MMSGYQGEVPIEEHGNGGGKQVREGISSTQSPRGDNELGLAESGLVWLE